MRKALLPILLGCGALQLIACRVTVTPTLTNGPSAPREVGALREGSRLKIVAISDGTTEFPLWFFDTEQNNACAVSRINDELRCWPFTYTQMRYSDASCTTKVAVGTKEACSYYGPSSVVADTDYSACTINSKYFKLGAVVTKPAKVYQKNGTNCTEDTYNVPANEYRAVGEEIAATAFPRFSELDDPELSSTLSSPMFESVDGARITARGPALFPPPTDLKQAGKACSPKAAGDGKLRCMPAYRNTLTSSPNFSDASCTKRVQQVFNSVGACGSQGSDSPYFASTVTGANGCVLGQDYLLVGDAVSAPLYSNASGMCEVLAAGPSSVSYRAVGAAVDPSTFAELTPTNVGTGRITFRGLKAGNLETPNYNQASIYDNTLQTYCNPITSATGTRCEPLGASFYYSDAACTQGFAQASKCDPAEPKTTNEIFAAASQCGVTATRFYRLGAKISQPAGRYYAVFDPMSGAKTCTEFTLSPEEAAGSVFYSLGSVLPESELAVITVN